MHAIYNGAGRDAYDVRGRVAHESIFNLNDQSYRCPNSQQGYSPFSTWTRGLAWAILGFAEQLEYLATLTKDQIENAAASSWLLQSVAAVSKRPKTARRRRTMKWLRKGMKGSGQRVIKIMVEAATATADFYLENSCADGLPIWDTGAPNLHRLPANYLSKPADPFNRWEPVDSSAAAIAAQGLVRLGNYLIGKGDEKSGARYRQAGLTITSALLGAPYLSTNPKHQGLLLHSVYHRPNGWDYIAPGQKVPNGESSMWGDYHLRELALLLWREARGESYLTFFDYTKR